MKTKLLAAAALGFLTGFGAVAQDSSADTAFQAALAALRAEPMDPTAAMNRALDFSLGHAANAHSE